LRVPVAKKTKTHFAFRIDVWDAAGDNVVDHLAGLDDYLMAAAAYRAATENKPSDKITLRQGARVILQNWCDSLPAALGSGRGIAGSNPATPSART
jgi:hypothetical protein